MFLCRFRADRPPPAIFSPLKNPLSAARSQVNLPSHSPSSDPIHTIQAVTVPSSLANEQNIDATIETAEQLVEQAIGSDPSQFESKPKLNKLIIQIPCFNEAETLGITLEELPRSIDGFENVQWLVIDDGSTDQTASVARGYGVDHIVQLPKNQGLARAFLAGIDEAVRQGADVIVNTDADNQYCAGDIQKLVDPIVNGQAEMVIGERPISTTPHFSRAKKVLQRVGSWVVRTVSKADVEDAPSGFRAISRATAMRLNVFSDYTYTLETIIQAGQKNMAVKSVPIRTNPDLRPSRLFKSIPGYVGRSAMTIIRIFMTYRPFHFFAVPGLACCLVGGFLYVRFLYFLITAAGVGHIQSLILGSMCLGVGIAGIVVGFIADLISVNRKLLEKVDCNVRELSENVRQQQAQISEFMNENAASADEVSG